MGSTLLSLLGDVLYNLGLGWLYEKGHNLAWGLLERVDPDRRSPTWLRDLIMALVPVIGATALMVVAGLALLVVAFAL